MLIFAVVGIPLLAILGAVLGWRSIKGRKLYRLAGSVTGFFTLPAVLILVMGLIFPNKAEVEHKKIYKNLSSLDARLICDNGDPGQGPDNTTPWYTAYYYINGNPDSESKIKQMAGGEGYNLTTDSAYISQLKGETNMAPYGDEAFNANSVYLVGHNNNKELKITLAKDGQIPTYCSKDYGQTVNVLSGKYILYSTVTIN